MTASPNLKDISRAEPPVTLVEESICGLLLGTAVGDALGLPAEGLSASRLQRRWPGEWRMRLLFGHGMFSDDTEHTIMVSQSLLSHPENAMAFQRRFASKLRWWLLAFPAGVGMATAKACLKLWYGSSPTRSGVRSAGNGPAMRVAVIGAFFAHDNEKRRGFVVASTEITHTDVRAEIGARAIAEAAAWIVQRKPFDSFLPNLSEISGDADWQVICTKIIEARKMDLSVRDFARTLGLENGVSGYVFHTVPVALYACARHHEDFRAALTESIACGGDTDTVGAIVGGLVGARVGKAGIPTEWLSDILEWPRSIAFLESLGHALASQTGRTGADMEVRYFWPGIIPRNLFFLVVVLFHGFRRLLPPY